MATTDRKRSAYAILGVQKNATAEEVKQAYVALVKKFDPEKHTERFMEIQKAFERLKDPVQRAREDVQTFNFVPGEYLFNEQEKANIPDPQIEQALEQIEKKRRAGELSEQDANAKKIHGLMLRSYKKVRKHLLAEAIQDWQDVLAIDPTHHRAKNNILYSYQRLGLSYANHQLFDEAVEVWEHAVQMNPDNTQIIQNLALAYQMAGRTDEATRYWHEVIKRWRTQLDQDPDNEYLKNCVIEVLREYGEGRGGDSKAPGAPAGGADKQPEAKVPAGGPVSRPDETGGGVAGAKSIEDLREILKLNPKDFQAHWRICNMLFHEKNWAEANRELMDLTRKFPRNVDVLNLHGWALLNSGKPDQAFTTWKKAMAIDPGNMKLKESMIKARMGLAKAYRERKLMTKAITEFKQLLKLTGDNDEVHFELGETFRAKGDQKAAYDCYRRVLELNPKHKLARNALSTLKLQR